jgi:primary-amine oxidase
MTLRKGAAYFAAAALALAGASGAEAHPLDPLSAEEINETIEALRAAGDIDQATRFPLIDLDEPDKQKILAWQAGQDFPRRAFVVARRRRTVYEGVVDLASRGVVRWRAVPGVEPSILENEWEAAQRIAIADPQWQAAMRRRGYTRFDRLFCAPFSAGYFADPVEEGRRLLKVACFDTSEPGNNVWSRPIEGLFAIVDLDEGKAVRVVDTGMVPVSRDPAAFAGAEPQEAAPKRQTFTLEGNELHWRNWSFHFRMDRRVGPILSLVRWNDDGRQRLVLYRGSISEMFVPYMDPAKGWAFRTYMDVGEYGFGLLSSPLAPGIDCPADAQFVDAVLPDETGTPAILKSRLCLFERDSGGPLWRHAEIVNQTYAGSPGKELVLRTIPAVGNYDYVVDWVLDAAGAIRVDVGATGIVEAKGVAARTLGDPTAAADTAYGPLIAPNLVGVDHDHFLSFRLDMDVDGQANTLVRERLSPERLDDGGRRSLWRVIDEPVRDEGALSGMPHGGAERWLVVNPDATNPLGGHPGYEVLAEHTATSLLAPDDFPQRRANFSSAPLWVTAYDPAELYAGGPYPNQSHGGDGLPAYVARQRPVVGADIVLWCTMGFHHVPRPEDWPVLPTMWHSISLIPNGFFTRNPALGAPPLEPAK